MYVCPECAHEWSVSADPVVDAVEKPVVRDAYGTVLADGDMVTVIKDLKIKGSSAVVKVGLQNRRCRCDVVEVGVCQEGLTPA
jgi:protein PhnA